MDKDLRYDSNRVFEYLKEKVQELKDSGDLERLTILKNALEEIKKRRTHRVFNPTEKIEVSRCEDWAIRLESLKETDRDNRTKSLFLSSRCSGIKKK